MFPNDRLGKYKQGICFYFISFIFCYNIYQLIVTSNNYIFIDGYNLL